MENNYLGIDIGGTAVKIAIVSESGKIYNIAEQSVCFDDYRTPILDTVVSATKNYLYNYSVEKSSLAGIAVSATGQIDSHSGVVVGTCGSLKGWSGSKIRERLEKTFDLPVTVANDANCMLLGECFMGAARGYSDVIGITIGTGVGGGILTGGRLLEGAHGLAGEIGHFPIHAIDGVNCTCKNIGCFERYASTSSLARSVLAENLPFGNGRTIFQAVRDGSSTVEKILDDWINEIAAGLIGLVHIFNPQLILIGGGVSTEQKLLIEPLAKKVKSGIMPAFNEGLEISAAELKNAAGLVGAVAYHISKKSKKLFL